MEAGARALESGDAGRGLASFNEAIDAFFSLLRGPLDPQQEPQVKTLAQQAASMAKSAKEKVIAQRSALKKMKNAPAEETGVVSSIDCAEFYRRIGDRLCEEAKAGARKFLLKSAVNAYITHAQIKTKVPLERKIRS